MTAPKPHSTKFSPPCTGELFPHHTTIDGVVFANEVCRSPGCIYETPYRVISSPMWDRPRRDPWGIEGWDEDGLPHAWWMR